MQAACLAKCNGANVTLHRSGTFSLQEFRQAVVDTCTSGEEHLVVSGSTVLAQQPQPHLLALVSTQCPRSSSPLFACPCGGCCCLHPALTATQQHVGLTGVRRAQVLLCCAVHVRVGVQVSYTRKAFGQTGDGHFSPIGGYHSARDLVLILDTVRGAAVGVSDT